MVKKLSATQLSKLWIHDKLDPTLINVEFDELQSFQENQLSDEVFEEAKHRVFEELAKYRLKFEEYINKYCKEK